jgi:type I restriction enzyme S subunit
MVADVTRDGMYVTPRIDSLTKEGAAKSRPMKAGDLVIAVSGAPGLPAILKTDACIHDGFVGLRNLNKKKICPVFLYRYLHHAKEQSGGNAVGAIFKNLTTDQIKGLDVPVPSLPEQHRIGKLLAIADEIRSKRNHAIQELNTLAVAEYINRYGHPTTAKKPKLIADCVKILSGGTPSKRNDAYWNGAFPWVSPKDMKVDFIEATQDHVTEKAFAETTLKKLPVQSVLIVIRGMILAHTVPVSVTRVPVAINQDMKAMIVKDGYDPIFLAWSLKAQHNYILSKVATAAHGTKRLEVEKLSSLPIPAIPYKEQKDFANVVLKIEQTHNHFASGDNEQLFQSLVQRAFRGEL